jgi:hypothetical protein
MRETHLGEKKFMMKKIIAALAMLTLISVSTAGAQEITVKVSGDRNAVVQVSETKPGKPDASGMVKASADFKAGKSAIDGQIDLKDRPETKDVNASFYTKASGKSIEAIGFLEGKVPPDSDSNELSVLSINAETVTEGDQSSAEFKVDIAGPKTEDAAPAGSGDMKFDGDFKAVNSSGNFSLSGPEIKSEDIPFQSMSFEISETENKTTISFEVKVPKASPMAAQLDTIPDLAATVEAQLKQANIQYEGLNFPAPTEEGELKVGKASMTLIDIRGTIRPFLGMASGQLQGEMGPDVDVQGAFEKMLEVRFEKLAFAMTVTGDKMDGSFIANMSNLDKFLEGYLVILPPIQEQSNRELAREISSEMGPTGMAMQPAIETFLNANANQGVDAIKAAIGSDLKMTGNAEFKLEDKEKDTHFTMSGNLLTTGYKDYVTKAKALGVPVAEKAVGKLNFDLKDGTQLVGDAYLYTDGDLLHFYKGLVTDSAKSANAPPEVVKELEAFDLKNMAFMADMSGNKVTLKGSSEATDLTGITKLILKQAQVDATLTGFSMDLQMPEAADAQTDIRIFFSEFLPGKNEAQIKEAMGLPAAANVAVDASSDDVKLVAVEAPEITVTGRLAEVQTSGQQLLAAGPSDSAGGVGGGAGGNKWGLIALGALLLVGVGGFLMFGKK